MITRRKFMQMCAAAITAPSARWWPRLAAGAVVSGDVVMWANTAI